MKWILFYVHEIYYLKKGGVSPPFECLNADFEDRVFFGSLMSQF